MRRRWWARIRLLGGVALLVVVVWRLGAGPFVAGLAAINAESLAAAVGIGVLTTVCCAWRWTVVARGLGLAVPLRGAVAAYYRSQFLNSTLPGGILGDVHRGVSHGREVGDVGRGLRAVAWERSAGQVVQLVLTLIVLLVLPSPVRPWMPAFAVGVLVVMLLLAGLLPVTRRGGGTGRRGGTPPGGGTRRARILQTAARDLRRGLLTRQAWPVVVIASTLVVVGHAATFLIAARTAGSSAPVRQLLPMALLVLAAMGLPTNIGGWGPREGVSAWAFGAAGLGATQGLATSVVYGVLALVATLPGAVVLVAAWLRRPRPRGQAAPSQRAESSVGAGRG